MALAQVAALAGAAIGCALDPGTARAEPDSADRIPLDHHILVDQFGYLPGEAKVAVIRDPQAGYDKNDHFSPGARYQLRRATDSAAVLTGRPAPWKGGATEPLSGDRGWWFDFSAVDAPGRYFVYDVDRNVRSAAFSIDPHVYRNVLKAAMRMYYYQRSGTAKPAGLAGACWADEAAYAGKNQDTEAHDVTDRDNAAKIRDLGGGWFDAGDTDKYVTFAAQAVHQLLTAFSANKAAFGDDYQIPESGNGIPDVLDEVRWETDWLKKMQYADGSFALKVGELDYVPASPPSSDHSPRFYVPSCTSATIAGAGMLAHAAYEFRSFAPLAAEARDLKARAALAWRQYQGGVFLGQADGPLLALARIGGPLLLTAGVWAGGAGLATIVSGLAEARAGRRAGTGAGAGRRAGTAVAARGTAILIGLGLAVALGSLAPDGGPAVRSVTVAVVQGGGRRGLDKEQVAPSTVFAAQVRATRPLLALARPPSLVLWPEDVIALAGPLQGSTQGARRWQSWPCVCAPPWSPG